MTCDRHTGYITRNCEGKLYKSNRSITERLMPPVSFLLERNVAGQQDVNAEKHLDRTEASVNNAYNTWCLIGSVSLWASLLWSPSLAGQQGKFLGVAIVPPWLQHHQPGVSTPILLPVILQMALKQHFRRSTRSPMTNLTWKGEQRQRQAKLRLNGYGNNWQLGWNLSFVSEMTSSSPVVFINEIVFTLCYEAWLDIMSYVSFCSVMLGLRWVRSELITLARN